MLKFRTRSRVATLVSIALLAPMTIVDAARQSPQVPQYAPGGLYTGDCAESLVSAATLEKGLKTIDDMVARTQKQLDDTVKAGGHMSRDAAKEATRAKTDLATDGTLSVISKVQAVRRALEKLARASLGNKALPVLKAINDVKHIEELYGRVKMMLAAGKGLVAMEEATSGMEQVANLGRFLDDFGITGELGGALAVKAGIGGTAAGGAAISGVVGALAVAVGVFAIDTVAAVQEDFQNLLDQGRAADTLNALKANRGVYQDKISAVRSRCTPKLTNNQAKPTQPSSPAPIATPDMAKSTGASAGKAIALVGLGTAGVAGAIVYGPQLISGLSGPDCSAQQSAMNNSANSLVAASNSLSSCGSNVTCLNSRLGTVNSGINSLINAAGNMCICMGSTELSAADKAVVVDLLAQLRSLGTSTGSLPSCFR